MFVQRILLASDQSLTDKQRLFALLLSLTALFSTGAFALMEEDQPQLRQIAQLAEYVSIDYVSAVDGGQVINPDEYREMVEFSSLIVEKTGVLADRFNELQPLEKQAEALKKAIQDKQDRTIVRQVSIGLRRSLLALMPNSPLPERLLPMETTEQIFQTNCANCHGVSGQGDGPLAAQLDPTPTNFADRERAENRSILGLFDAISNGIDSTAMPAFNQLTELERWSLAFYAGSLAFESALDARSTHEPKISVQQMVNHSPSQLRDELPGIINSDVEWLRAAPARLFAERVQPLSLTRKLLLSAFDAHQRGEYNEASDLSVSAYLDGFELVESSLDTRDKVLRKHIEVSLMELRQVLGRPGNENELRSLMDATLQQLEEAEQIMSESSLSNGTLFTASLVILLREGLEALLVVIALVTVLLRTQRQDALKYVHLGWTAALIAGGATWAAAQSLISISGASREMMEGVAALLAALVLFYVGIWMHSKTYAAQWQTYIKQHIETRLQTGTLWGLAGLAFVAVYREVFETVLFYQSLLTQAANTQYWTVAGGFVLGAVILAVLAWILMRYSIKLPIEKFFAATTYLLLALSFVLMGKAVAALQEAAVISISPLPISFEFDWIGVKSTWQGILAQLAILLFFTVSIFRSRTKQIVTEEA
jgi:high-affinity iron transporter